MVDGNARMGELSEKLGVDLPREGYETLAGFLAWRLQRVPARGDTVEFRGLTFTVTEATQRRVRKVLVEVKPEEDLQES